MGHINVLVIHGVGNQNSAFDEEMREEFRNRLGADFQSVNWVKIHWADVLERGERLLWERMEATGQLDQAPLRRFLLSSAADALSYRHSGEEGAQIYDGIHELVAERIRFMLSEQPEAPVVVLAHSLGAQIMSDYIWDRQASGGDDPRPPLKNLVGMITFGCNIPLFAMSAVPPRPITVPARSAPQGLPSVWKNFFDPDDVLGWPLRPLYQAYENQLSPLEKRTYELIEDIPINTGWLLSAHFGYWTDNDFTKPVAVYLKQLIDEC